MNKKKSQTLPNADALHQKDESLASSTGSVLASLNEIGQSKQKLFSAKEVIYRESDSADKVFFILTGKVKLLSYLPNGRARIVRIHNQDHWLGLEGLIGQPYEHTAIAVDDVEVCYVPTANICLLEQDDPQLYCEILKQGFSQLGQAAKWIADFSTGGIKSRVARLLDFLAKLEHGESPNMVELLTVHEMADMLGVTAESVSRIMAEFKRNDTLLKLENDSDSGELYEIDPQQLEHEAGQ